MSDRDENIASDKASEILDTYVEKYPQADVDREMLFSLIVAAVDTQVKTGALHKAFHDLAVVERNHAENSLRWANITVEGLKRELADSPVFDASMVTYMGRPALEVIEEMEAQLQERDATVVGLQSALARKEHELTTLRDRLHDLDPQVR